MKYGKLHVSMLLMVTLVLVLAGQADNVHAGSMATMNIPFTGVASGGELVLADTLNRNARYVSITTQPGQSAESVADALAKAIYIEDPFYWNPDGSELPLVTSAGGVLTGLVGFQGSAKYLLAGTEKGLGIPPPPLSLTCNYDPDAGKIHLHWINPPDAYDRIVIVFNWSDYDSRGGIGLAGDITSYVLDTKERPVNPDDLDLWVVGFKADVPSNAAAMHLAGKAQEELFGIPFTNGVAPNWTAWLQGDDEAAIGFEQETRNEYIYKRFPSNEFPYNSIPSADAKPFVQMVQTKSDGVQGGVYRKFLGLTPGHTYKISVRVNTYAMTMAGRPWSSTLHAAHNGLGGVDLTKEQMAGLAALPDKASGPQAGLLVSYGPDKITAGDFKEDSATITPPADVDSITVWARNSGSSTRVGMSCIKLEDVTP
jgi:hypothetical protein